MKSNLFIVLFITACLSAGFAYAGEEGAAEKPKAEAEGGEHENPKEEEKARPDSVLSSVLVLPVVKAWKADIEAKGDGSTLTAWGEAVKMVNDYECWGVAVGKTNGDKTNTWRRFCVTPGGRVWVESMPDPKDDEITYTIYDEWVSKCKPTSDSTGNC